MFRSAISVIFSRNKAVLRLLTPSFCPAGPDRQLVEQVRTEGSYIEPDTAHGLKYLEAIRDVFGRKPES